MDKSPEAFRTISEVAEWLDVPTHVLRFWESRFTQVKPVKRAGGRRYYRPTDMALLGGIKKLLHEDGLTIRGVQKVLREQGVKHVAALAPGPEGTALAIDAPGSQVADAAGAGASAPAAAPHLVEVPTEADPDAALLRFPFIDEPDEAEADAPEPEPGAMPAPDTAPEGDPQVDSSAVAAFVAAVPETDPEDDDPAIAVAGALPVLTVPGRAARLAPHADALHGIYDRARALRDRIAARAMTQSR